MTKRRVFIQLTDFENGILHCVNIDLIEDIYKSEQRGTMVRMASGRYVVVKEQYNDVLDKLASAPD